MMLRVELRPLAASIVVVVRQLDPSQVPTVDSGVGHRAIRWYDLVVQCAVLLLAPPRVGRAEVVWSLLCMSCRALSSHHTRERFCRYLAVVVVLCHRGEEPEPPKAEYRERCLMVRTP